MPWSGKSFAERHNHKLKGARAEKAAAQATAMVRAGVPEGTAIAVANKNAARHKAPPPRKQGIINRVKRG